MVASARSRVADALTDDLPAFDFALLNPPQQFPTQDPAVRAFAGPTHAQSVGFTDLTPDQYYALVLANEMGVNFYARENAPVAAYQD